MKWSLGVSMLTALVSASAAPAAEEREITGRVLDAQGKPVAGVEVAIYWYQRKDRLEPRAPFRTDTEGRFQGKLRWHGRSRSLMSLDAERKRGAVVLLDEQSLGKPLTLQLAPLVELRATFKSTGLGYPPERVYSSVNAGSAIIAVAAATGGPSLSLRLPPGRFRLTVRPRDCKRWVKTITLQAKDGKLDLGTVDVEPTVIAKLYGKTLPPWTLTEARGVSKETRLSDFRGKWVLLEFWGYW